MSKQNRSSDDGFNVIRVPYWATDKLGSRAAKSDRERLARYRKLNPSKSAGFSSNNLIQLTQELLDEEIAVHGPQSILVKMLKRQLEDFTDTQTVATHFRSAPIENRRST